VASPSSSPIGCREETALRETLPESLRGRVRTLVGGQAAKGAFVLYWMRVAVRDHENAALDAAIEAGNALGLPVLVYHAVSERYPYASDRHHTFLLEGARDVAEGLARRGLAYALHVERPGARGPFLVTLATQAALVVTEEMPVPPLREWTTRLAEHLTAANVPLWIADASCVVPLARTRQRYDRAYAFRTATKAIAEAALDAAWVEAIPRHPPADVALPFSPIDPRTLDDRAIAALVATCAIDHGVGPIRAMRGGSRAGYERWQHFRDELLVPYARDRNNPLVDATSRLSPYLHMGFVSALRLAREARALEASGTKGPSKYLDELLVWREAAWHYAAHTPATALSTLAALPSWATDTLAEHALDSREPRSSEQLARGRTGDALWDAAQRSLLAHGELHNNVRMTWGKAVLGWSADAETARARLVDLNHRYALDGRDPASYGGLYWCLGLFDRPFPPARSVEGTLRPRPLHEHAARLDVQAYTRLVGRPALGRVRRVAVVGGGLAGLACARTLADHHVDVVVFDKGRAPGGRLATRRTDAGGFDLGAQYFTARDERFRHWVASWLEEGVIAPWTGRIVACDGVRGAFRDTEPQERFVGTPGMNAMAHHLARDLHVRSSHRVDRLVKTATGINVRGLRAEGGVTLAPRGGHADADLGEEDWGTFDAIVVCLPADQARDLLAPISPALAAQARRVKLEPTFAVGLTDRAAEPALRALPFDGAFIGREGQASPSCLSWIARDSSKPGRAPGERWMLHASAAWSREQGDRPREAIGADMVKELSRLFELGPLDGVESFVHRWGFARASEGQAGSIEAPASFDEDNAIALGGDWAAGGRVEGAYLSGVALAGRVLGVVA
jgi:hypothetical protein